ncbi:MAG: DEAD/DEAH box helicase [Anaeroplasmataceae bacterium]|nr:DEAD/DEAH box helicase [Anaeroplasmataceae bacterium]
MNDFLNMNIDASVLAALEENNITNPTPIQQQAIPHLLEGKDVIGQAQTGTGKTFAYAIPLLERLDVKKKAIQALIMCPTRELSLQVCKEIEKLAKYTKVKATTIYGGESYEKQFRELAKKPQIIIGTPGRIIDHLNRGTLSFKEVSYLVLDEADEMLKMGFEEDMETILSEVPQVRQTSLFSATLPPWVKQTSKKYMKEPVMVRIEQKTLTVEKIKEVIYYVKREQKKDVLMRLLDYYQLKSVMIFANTKAMVDELVLFLQENHFKADGLHGDLKQLSRDRVMQSFRLGSIEILIATDVAARGIDVENVEAIINYDLPQENEIYVHRIGRTGRAGKTGLAITLATTRQVHKVQEIEAYTKSNLEVSEIPTPKQIATKVQKGLTDKIISGLDEALQNHNYDNLLRDLARKTTDPTPIIIRLLELLTENMTRNYLPVDTVHPKTKSKTSVKPVSSWVYIAINLGSEDKLRPNQLVNYLHDELSIHREHFGKIIIKKDVTYVELNSLAVRFLKDLKNKKFLGKRLTYQQVKSLPKR